MQKDNWYFELGVSALKNKKFNDAIDLFQKSIFYNKQLNLNSSKDYVNIGFCLIQLERYQDALLSTKIALDLNPNSINGQYIKALALKELSKVNEALPIFNELLDKAEEYLLKNEITQHISECYKISGDTPDSIDSYHI